MPTLHIRKQTLNQNAYQYTRVQDRNTRMALTAYLMSRLLFLLHAFISFHFLSCLCVCYYICLYFGKAAFHGCPIKCLSLSLSLCVCVCVCVGGGGIGCIKNSFRYVTDHGIITPFRAHWWISKLVLLFITCLISVVLNLLRKKYKIYLLSFLNIVSHRGIGNLSLWKISSQKFLFTWWCKDLEHHLLCYWPPFLQYLILSTRKTFFSRVVKYIAHSTSCKIRT